MRKTDPKSKRGWTNDDPRVLGVRVFVAHVIVIAFSMELCVFKARSIEKSITRGSGTAMSSDPWGVPSSTND
jgi:hypothetical protein